MTNNAGYKELFGSNYDRSIINRKQHKRLCYKNTVRKKRKGKVILVWFFVFNSCKYENSMQAFESSKMAIQMVIFPYKKTFGIHLLSIFLQNKHKCVTFRICEILKSWILQGD